MKRNSQFRIDRARRDSLPFHGWLDRPWPFGNHGERLECVARAWSTRGASRRYPKGVRRAAGATEVGGVPPAL